MRPETKCLHEGYKAGNGEPLALPIYQSTTFRYDTASEVAKLFDLTADGHMYSRISNPTVAAVEAKIAALEGGVGAVCTSSGQAASLTAVLNICSAGDHFISSSKIYGGTVNLFSVTLKRMGIDVTFVDPDASEEEIAKEFRPNTKLVFGESVANPAISVLDIEKFARLAHSHGVPLIVDNTFPTPILLRPFEYGADIVVHSTSKYMDGHAIQVGGVVVDSGNFDWKDYPCLTEPDESYHGLIYTEAFGKAAYITKLRVQLIRDFGVLSSANSAFLLDLGLQTLGVRMDRHCRNAEAMALALESHPNVESVNYPTLESNPYHEIAKKYLPNGASGVISFVIKGGREAAARFMDNVRLANNVVHVADVRTCVLHPASETHRQLTDEQLVACGVSPGLIRLSVGIEHIDDIKEDILGALDRI
ncbi:MAG: O-acetylhomoserine aminocarboxypropyltransferase/cysteine synthase [Clostridia bacterium]|nr:O-acetylhomoserine aminocarboxypropyltransferase/cysteine synthase [Clostridia bacterium]